MSATTQSLLVELGTEELPVKALPGLADAFLAGIRTGLEKRGIGFDADGARVLYTPRRIAVVVDAVQAQQPEQRSEVLGPAVNVALTADGQPSPALLGFAGKNGVDWTALERIATDKGERFVFRAVKPGASTVSLLQEILHEAVKGLPIPKPMRWGNHDHAFARPLHWLVLLFGEQVVDCVLFGIKSDRMSRGHRFHHGKAVWIADAASYVDALRGACVLADPQEREARIRASVGAMAQQAGGHARIDEGILAEVNCLTEWPYPVLCSFERDFLAVPQEALIATMEANQKFFPVLDSAGRLTEQFIGVANIESRNVDEVRKGYERVIRPRFADARFFFDEDRKQGLAAMNAGLASVTYQQKLGSVADKVARVAALAEVVAKAVGVDPAQARRAAELSKADLQSRLVNEFPELQGIAGRHYAIDAGESKEIALAIDEAYRPRFSGDDIALSPLGKVLAIAERLDTLAGGFAAGLRPTGNKDAFALRRNALGLARTIIESGFDVSVTELLKISSLYVQPNLVANSKAMEEFSSAINGIRDEGVDFSISEASNRYDEIIEAVKRQQPAAAEIFEFMLDRLRSYYADKGVPATHFNAVAELRPSSLYDFDSRIDAIGLFAQLPEADALAAANKRIRNILRKTDEAIPHDIDRALLKEPAESALAEALFAAEGDTGAELAHHDYVSVLKRLALLRAPIDAFFDGVMVMADDADLRRNRLALLKRLSDRFLAVADVSLLASG